MKNILLNNNLLLISNGLLFIAGAILLLMNNPILALIFFVIGVIAGIYTRRREKVKRFPFIVSLVLILLLMYFLNINNDFLALGVLFIFLIGEALYNRYQ